VPGPRAQKQKHRRAAKRAAAVAGVIILVLLIGGAVAAYAFVQGLEREMQTEIVQDEKVTEALTEKAPEEPFNILLLGSDARPQEEAARADTIIVARVDPEAKRVWMLSIPRDTRVEIPEHGVNKINAANYLGGPALMIDTIEGFLDMPIHHYMAVDFNGFQGIVDAMGGIYVNVEQEIDDWRAASHSPSNRAKHIEPGYQLLDGEHALTFVRSRDFPDADFTRMKHQQEFFKALASQSMRWSNVLKLPGMAREFAKNVSTDVGVGQILSLAQSFRGIDATNVQTATLPGEWRSPYIVPDTEMKEYLVSQILENGDIEEQPGEEDLLAPADISVAVRNGGGIAGSAAMAAERLRARGFDVREVGNANQFVYEETLVVYTDNEEAADLVARQLKTERTVPSRGMYSFTTDILVVVGADWTTLVGAEASEQ
jgi:LCP family protein required for cell wall assembly